MAENTIRWGAAKRLVTRIRAREVTDGATTSGDATVTSATALFTQVDVGKPISGTGIPLGATILSVTSATSIEISANATATAAGVTLVIGRSGRRVADGVTADGSTTVTSATAEFTEVDEGRSIEGAGIPSGTRVASVTSSTSIELSAEATADATGVTLRIGRGLDGVQVEPGYPGDTQTDESVWVDGLDGDVEIPVMTAGRKMRDDEFKVPFAVRVAGLPTLDATMARLSEIVAALEDELADDPGLGALDGLIDAVISSETLTVGQLRTVFIGFGQVVVDCHARYE